MSNKMIYRNAGNSDLKLSVIGLGCWALGGGNYWGDIRPEEEEKLIRTAIDLGINYLDTAEMYYDGRSEEALGRVIKDIPREKMVIGSKIFPTNAYYDKTIAHCEASLKRLGTDYLDLYMVHWPLNSRSLRQLTNDPELLSNPPQVEETTAALLKLRDDGKIRHIGVSNFGRRWMELFEQNGVHPAINQLAYNSFSRAIEYEIAPYCQSSGTGIMGYSVLMQGILTGRYQTLDEIPARYLRTRHFHKDRSPDSRHGGDGAEEEVLKALKKIREISEQSGIGISELNIWWAIQNKAVTSVLVGTRSADRLIQNVQGAMKSLSKEVYEAVNEATRPLMDALGTSFDYYEHPSEDRTLYFDDIRK